MINLISVSKIGIWEEGTKLLVRRMMLAFRSEKKLLLLLSGGSAVNLYQRLAEYIKRSQFVSENLAVGQVDERFRPENSDDINAVQIEKTGLIEVLKRKGIKFYKILQKGSLERAADEYNRIMEELFRSYKFKMAILGIGRDGHTAGLLPGYRKEWDKNTFVTGYKNKGEFPERITITPKAFGRLDYGLTIVAGEEKREVMEGILKKKEIDVNLLPGILINRIKKVETAMDLKWI